MTEEPRKSVQVAQKDEEMCFYMSNWLMKK